MGSFNVKHKMKEKSAVSAASEHSQMKREDNIIRERKKEED
jgi:hypothetical protein